MGEPKYSYRVEMTAGQDQREVGADLWREDTGWLIFYRTPPQGGKFEYWRVRIEHVVSIYTALKGRAQP